MSCKFWRPFCRAKRVPLRKGWPGDQKPLSAAQNRCQNSRQAAGISALPGSVETPWLRDAVHHQNFIFWSTNVHYVSELNNALRPWWIRCWQSGSRDKESVATTPHWSQVKRQASRVSEIPGSVTFNNCSNERALPLYLCCHSRSLLTISKQSL